MTREGKRGVATRPAGATRAVAGRGAIILVIAALLGWSVGPAALATAFVVVLLLLQPLTGKRRYEELARRTLTDPSARLDFYLRSTALKWVYVAVVALVGGFAGRGAASIGLAFRYGTPGGRSIGTEYVVITTVLMAVTTAALWWAGPGLLNAVRRQLASFAAILPRTTSERIWFVWVALTAGVTEEIIYRGFGISYVRWLLPGAGHPTIILLTAAAFGLAHLYQGPRNVLLTGFAGGFFAWLVLATGSLIPAILVHTLVDLRVCALPPSVLPVPGGSGPDRA